MTEPDVQENLKIIENWNERRWHHPRTDEVLIIQRLRPILKSDDLLAQVLEVLDNICVECWDAEARCRCWDDS